MRDTTNPALKWRVGQMVRINWGASEGKIATVVHIPPNHRGMVVAEYLVRRKDKHLGIYPEKDENGVPIPEPVRVFLHWSLFSAVKGAIRP